MTSTSQDKKTDAEAKTGASPEQAKDEGNAKTVPLGEHIELRQKHRAMEEELKALRDQLAKKQDPPAPAGPAEKSIQDDIRELKRDQRIRSLSDELGVSSKQSAAIAELMDKTPGLSSAEAKSLATMRQPDLFKDGDDGFDPRTHGAARPGVRMPEPVVEKDDFKERLDLLKTIDEGVPHNKRNIARRDQLMANLIGSLAAHDVGKPGHELIRLQ